MSGFDAPIRWKFQCPKCSGFAYGTTRRPGEVETGYCQADGEYRCPGFSWPRIEDWKHFHLVVKVPEELHGARAANDATAARVLFIPEEHQKQLEQAEEQMHFWAERMKALSTT